jgi:hypothetical protein
MDVHSSGFFCGLSVTAWSGVLREQLIVAISGTEMFHYQVSENVHLALNMKSQTILNRYICEKH